MVGWSVVAMDEILVVWMAELMGVVLAASMVAKWVAMLEY
jgi:hypothetical protein